MAPPALCLPSLALPVLAAGILLTGCVGPTIEELRHSEASGDGFTTQQAEEYRPSTLVEADEVFDWLAAEHFASKGLRAVGGESEQLEEWDLPADMAETGRRMIETMRVGARGKLTELAARAQDRLDCWMEQPEVNRRPGHTSACHAKLHGAVTQLEQTAGADPARAALPLATGDDKPKHDPAPPLKGLAPKAVTGSGQPTAARRRPRAGRRLGRSERS